MRTATLLASITLLLVFISAGQTSPSTPPRPLSLADVEHGLKSGISNARMTELVKQYGIDFELTDAVEKQLRGAGANGDLLFQLVRSRKQPPPYPVQSATPQAQSRATPREDDAAVQMNLGATVADINTDIAARLDVPAGKGVVVREVVPGGFADRLGLDRGNVILEINKQPVNTAAEYSAIQGGLKAGQDVVFLVRTGRAANTHTSFLAGTLPAEVATTTRGTANSDAPQQKDPADPFQDFFDRFFGNNGTRAGSIGAELSATAANSGAVVAQVLPGGPAAAAGLQSGDTIVSLQQKPITNPDDFRSTVSEFTPGTNVHISFIRNGNKHDATVTIADISKLGQIENRGTGGTGGSSAGTAQQNAGWSPWVKAHGFAVRTHCAADPSNPKQALAQAQLSNIGSRTFFVKGNGLDNRKMLSPGGVLNLPPAQTKDCSKGPDLKLDAHEVGDSNGSWKVEYKQGKLTSSYHVSKMAMFGAAMQGAAAGTAGQVPPTPVASPSDTDSSVESSSGGAASGTGGAPPPDIGDFAHQWQFHNECVKGSNESEAGGSITSIRLVNVCNFDVQVWYYQRSPNESCWTGPFWRPIARSGGHTNVGVGGPFDSSNTAEVRWDVISNTQDAPSSDPYPNHPSPACNHR